MRPTRHIALELDLATDNNIPYDQIRRQIPEDADVQRYQISEFEAPRTPEATLQSGWHRWSRPFDEMLAQARSDSPSDEYTLEYHVFGRTPLPLATYAGLGISGSAQVTVHNPRKQRSEMDSIKLEIPEARPSGPLYFAEQDPRSFEYQPDGVVALAMSAGQGVNPELLRRYLQEQEMSMCGLLELHPPRDARTLVDVHSAPTILWQLGRAWQTLNSTFPRRRGVVAFIAGPVSLAFMAGWTAPNYARPLWLPNHDKSEETPRYRPALNFPRAAPRRLKPRILVLAASPSNEGAVDIQGELGALTRALEPVRGRFELISMLGFTGPELTETLRRYTPDIVHVICHGTTKGGLVPVQQGSLNAAEIVVREVREAFEHADPPPRLVVLHACHSGEVARGLTDRIDTTIGTNSPIYCVTAVKMTDEFYRALADGYKIHAAYDRAKLHLSMTEVPGAHVLEMHQCPAGDRGEWTPFPRT